MGKKARTGKGKLARKRGRSKQSTGKETGEKTNSREERSGVRREGTNRG